MLSPLPCPACGACAVPTVGPGSGPHYAKALCRQCGHFLRWLPKSLVAKETRMAGAGEDDRLIRKSLFVYESRQDAGPPGRARPSPCAPAVLRVACSRLGACFGTVLRVLLKVRLAYNGAVGADLCLCLYAEA